LIKHRPKPNLIKKKIEKYGATILSSTLKEINLVLKNNEI